MLELGLTFILNELKLGFIFELTYPLKTPFPPFMASIRVEIWTWRYAWGYESNITLIQ